MPPINSNERLGEVFSAALEDRSSGYQDLVSNSNILLAELKARGGWKTFSGPTIRETLLYAESGTYTRYAGYDFLNPKPAELFGDAEWDPRMAAVSITMPNEDILKTSGTNQVFDLFEAKMKAAETELEDRFNEDLHGAGTLANQISGLQLAVPTVATSGTYAGISRTDFPLWRTKTFDVQSDFAGMTQVTATTIKPIWNNIMIQLSRGRRGPDLILTSSQHFLAYQAATEAIQRITDDTRSSKLGFTSLKFFGSGRSVDIVLEGGIGSAMPDNVTYFLDMDSFKFRYHPERNFSKIGGKMMPVNQDAIVQHIGFMGELTMSNPMHNAKLVDSNPAA